MDRQDLASRLFGNRRAETAQTLTAGETLTYTATAVSDSESGSVLIAPFGEYITEGDDAYIEVDTTTPVSKGDIVFVTLYGGTVGKHMVVTGVVGKGDELLDIVEQAHSDAQGALETANDVPIVTLSSTNGTVFKRNLGVDTTIVATIFTPGGRIDNATELRNRFGAGAYLEWGWRDVVTDANHVLVNTDPRIGNSGFSLTVSPEDIDSQAVITCSLNY